MNNASNPLVRMCRWVLLFLIAAALAACATSGKYPPAPAAGEALCRTLELGICGTDREILHSAAPWTPVGEAHLILGHECLARIEDVVTRQRVPVW